jgi:hypothetical protein
VRLREYSEPILRWFFTAGPQKTCRKKTVTGRRPVSTVRVILHHMARHSCLLNVGGDNTSVTCLALCILDRDKAIG